MFSTSSTAAAAMGGSPRPFRARLCWRMHLAVVLSTLRGRPTPATTTGTPQPPKPTPQVRRRSHASSRTVGGTQARRVRARVCARACVLPGASHTDTTSLKLMTRNSNSTGKKRRLCVEPTHSANNRGRGQGPCPWHLCCTRVPGHGFMLSAVLAYTASLASDGRCGAWCGAARYQISRARSSSWRSQKSYENWSITSWACALKA